MSLPDAIQPGEKPRTHSKPQRHRAFASSSEDEDEEEEDEEEILAEFMADHVTVIGPRRLICDICDKELSTPGRSRGKAKVLLRIGAEGMEFEPLHVLDSVCCMYWSPCMY